MKRQRWLGITLFMLVLLFSMLACQTLTKTEPTVPPKQALPTQPSPPTKAPTVAPAPTDTKVSSPIEPSDKPTATRAPVDVGPDNPDIVPGALNVIQLGSYQDEFGDWHVSGLVSNNMERAVSGLEIEVEVFDANDASLYKEIAYSSLYSLAPGDVSPFELWISEDLPAADHFVATVVGNGTAELDRASVDIEKTTLVKDDSGDYHLSGQVVNNTDGPVQLEGLAVALFDSNKELINVGTTYVLMHYLDAGDDSPFRFMLDAPEGVEVDTFEFYVDSTVTELAEGFDISLSDDHHDYVDTFNNFHLVGSITNNSDKHLSVSLVAGIYDADGNVLDASSSYLAFYSIAPGESVPYDFNYWGPMSYVKESYDKATDYTVQVDWWGTYEAFSELIDLSTSDDANTFDSYEGTFTGKVVNNSGEDVSGATVVVSMYNKSDGVLVATNYTYVTEIANGASMDYTVYVAIPEGFDPASVEFEIKAKGDKK